MAKNKIIEQAAELNALRLRMFEVARNTSTLIEPADFDGCRDEIRAMFNRLHVLSTELVAHGSADGLSAISELHGSLKQYAMMKIDSPEARDIFVLALCEQFQLNEDMYSRIVGGGVSQEVRAKLFKSLVDYDPLNENMIVYLNGIDDQNYIDAFITYFSRVSNEGESQNLIEIAGTLTKRLNSMRNLETYIEAFSANIDKLSAGYEKIINMAKLEWPKDQVGSLKLPFNGALGFTAEFICGIHSACRNKLTESLCKIGLGNPAGRHAYITYEQYGVLESPAWHVERQKTSRNGLLTQHHSYAILNDDVMLILPEEAKFGSRFDFELYLSTIIKVPMAGNNSFEKLKSIIDHVLAWESEKFKSVTQEFFMKSTIDPRLLTAHPEILGDRFSKDLGM